MSKTDIGMVETLKQMGAKFMICKFGTGYELREVSTHVREFQPTTIVADDLDYDEAVALFKLLEGNDYE